ncbi:MAG: DNA repair protein RecN [Planctomycetota bacterium]
MLRFLTVRGFALLEDVHVEFEAGLNVVTGETGAGKSLLVDAIGFLLGERADASRVRTGSAEASVEGVFEIPDGRAREDVARLIEEKTGTRPEDGIVVLSRTLDGAGRSRAFVCNRFLTREALREIAGHLITVHGQKEHSTLAKNSTQREKIDAFAGVDGPDGLRIKFTEKRSAASAIFRELFELRRAERARLDRLDLLRFQAGEIRGAELKPGELAALKEEFNTLTNSSAIYSKLSQQLESLHESEGSAVERLSNARRAFQELALLAPNLAPLAERAEEAKNIVDDIVSEARHYCEKLDADPRRLEFVTDRLDRIQRILDRFKVDEAAAIVLLTEMEAEIQKLSGAEQRGEELEHDLKAILDEMFVIGCKLTAARAAASPKLAIAVREALAGLEMTRAEFRVLLREIPAAKRIVKEEPANGFDTNQSGKLYELDEPESLARSNAFGFDEIQFEISANPGEPPKPIGEIASGGELARLALAIESACAERVSTPIILFDEIDENVGGRLGPAIGIHLRKVAAPRQVLVVTHLAGVAAYSNRHIFVSKSTKDGRTHTNVRALAGWERIEELAAMLAGDGESETAQAEACAIFEAAHGTVPVRDSSNGELKPKSKAKTALKDITKTAPAKPRSNSLNRTKR